MHAHDRRDGPLRIGMIAPPWFEVPPAGYGGIEAVVAGLVDQLVRHGHHVVAVEADDLALQAERAAYELDQFAQRVGARTA